ncbi:glutathione S-transferase N-terminal domain-containing protein [Neorhizobium sp. JUb45]|uniref:glutathione S-transferase N-terminal domain-containing protein n=1 Tax=Neorhizobium sp. JUb45 TaxID=2485113 RepID=UPI001048407D|nr:glutathione S-transferase N-terminal domain-containing protein [Neorhizobium sp. JUb45]TCQ97970.1 glutathione S-transferase-like protein [Neorhizobium sp. JUb45]
MKLYIYEHCPFCTRARLALGVKNIPYETVIVMEGDAETPTRLIGKKAVPILERPDELHLRLLVHFGEKRICRQRIRYPQTRSGTPRPAERILISM